MRVGGETDESQEVRELRYVISGTWMTLVTHAITRWPDPSSTGRLEGH